MCVCARESEGRDGERKGKGGRRREKEREKGRKREKRVAEVGSK